MAENPKTTSPDPDPAPDFSHDLEDDYVFVRVNQAKVGNEGLRLLGEIDGIERVLRTLARIHVTSKDPIEQRVLRDLVNVLLNDISRVKAELYIIGRQRGAIIELPDDEPEADIGPAAQE